MEWTGGDKAFPLPAYVHAHNPARVFAQGNRKAYALAAAWPHRLYMVFYGDVSGGHILGALHEVVQSGVFPDDRVSALVDMLMFSGTVDWSAMVRISDIMPRGNCRTNRNAYIVRDAITASLTKVNAVHFPDTTHRAFHDEAKALHWLGWE